MFKLFALLTTLAVVVIDSTTATAVPNNLNKTITTRQGGGLNVPANAFSLQVGEYAFAQANSGGWQGFGEQYFTFMFDGNYRQEGFVVKLYDASASDWQNSQPTASIQCTAGVNASPTAVMQANIFPTSTWVTVDGPNGGNGYLNCDA